MPEWKIRWEQVRDGVWKDKSGRWLAFRFLGGGFGLIDKSLPTEKRHFVRYKTMRELKTKADSQQLPMLGQIKNRRRSPQKV